MEALLWPLKVSVDGTKITLSADPQHAETTWAANQLAARLRVVLGAYTVDPSPDAAAAAWTACHPFAALMAGAATPLSPPPPTPDPDAEAARTPALKRWGTVSLVKGAGVAKANRRSSLPPGAQQAAQQAKVGWFGKKKEKKKEVEKQDQGLCARCKGVVQSNGAEVAKPVEDSDIAHLRPMVRAAAPASLGSSAHRPPSRSPSRAGSPAVSPIQRVSRLSLSPASCAAPNPIVVGSDLALPEASSEQLVCAGYSEKLRMLAAPTRAPEAPASLSMLLPGHFP
mmetsp:Transcript_22874/g.51730  ORF Transcript_22874/g.51730 Transcript_22874/m.51730 type:complete len:283 (+) Transcript_22874:44-892(+)